MQHCSSLCKYKNEVIKMQIMIVGNEVGRQKCVMEIYVEKLEVLDELWFDGNSVYFVE